MRSLSNLPPSPLDPALRWLEIGKFVAVGIAGYCGWQIAEWWGIGLVAALFVVDVLNEWTVDTYRMELWEGVARTVRRVEAMNQEDS